MNALLNDPSAVASPALLVLPDQVKRNIAAVVAMAGTPTRLRPHVKTHKTIEIVQLLLAAGVTAHKCATIAEAELLARAGATDVLIAYPLVGPNVARWLTLKRLYPDVRFASLLDHPLQAEQLSNAVVAAGTTADFVVDVDVGQHRTGVPLTEAEAFYKHAASLPGLRPAGLQAYDGHNSMEDRSARDAAVAAWLDPVLRLRTVLERAGLAVPRIVVGGTPTFPVLATHSEVPGLECSPGTFVLHDYGYGTKFEDLKALAPAALLLTRVVSRPTTTRVTLDLGTKAVASDPPMVKRAKLLNMPEYEIVGHNEEHLVIETAAAADYLPGDVLYAVPGHVCPTVALHKEMLTVENGTITGTWTVLARDRRLTV